MTKLAAVAAVVLVASAATGAAAFSPSRTPIAAAPHSGPSTSLPTTTSLGLFGSKPKDPNAASNQPGMMDQLAMFKKAQEIAQKKQALDKELSAERIVGTAADGKVEVVIKYVAPNLPASPTPGYEASEVDIDADYLEATSVADLGEALVEAIRDGERRATERVGEKYKELEEDLKGIMGGMAAPQQ